MNGLEAYIDLLEKSDLVTGQTEGKYIAENNYLSAALAQERRRTTERIIRDLKKIQV